LKLVAEQTLIDLRFFINRVRRSN